MHFLHVLQIRSIKYSCHIVTVTVYRVTVIIIIFIIIIIIIIISSINIFW